MAQTRPGRTPEAGRPRGAVWRALVGEGITWEGQVIISGEHADLDARMIVTGARVVFVRNGTIALDARREWLDPAPVMGRGGRVSLWISTPGGSGPIPIEIRSRDGQFGATRMVTRLLEGLPAGVDDGRAAPVPLAPVVEPAATVDEPRHVEVPEPSVGRPIGFGAVPVVEPSARAAPSTPSFGYNPAPTRPARPARPAENPIATDATGRDRFSVEAINRAFGASPQSTDAPAMSPQSAPGSDPSLAGRWSLSSELLARTVAPADRPSTEASPDHPVASVDDALEAPTSGPRHTPSRAAASTKRTDPPPVEPGAPDRPAPSGPLPVELPPLPLPSLSATPNLPRPIAEADRARPSRDDQGRSLRADPVPHARSPEGTGRAMLPGLPAATPVSPAASERNAVSAAPSGRRAGNSVITARSSAAARQSAKQAAAGAGTAGEAFPSAVAIASATAGLPLAPLPGPVPGGEIPVLAGDGETPDRRPLARRLLSGRVMWGATAALLVALTVAAGLYLALGLPEGDGDGGLIGGGGEATSSDDGSVALLASTPGPSRSGASAAPSIAAAIVPSSGAAAGRPTPTVTPAVPRGVGGIGDSIPIRASTTGSSAASEASASASAEASTETTAESVAATEPASSQAEAPTATVADPSPTVATAPTSASDDVTAAGDDASASGSVAESVAPSESPPVSPSASVAPDSSVSPSASSAGSPSAGPSASSETSASGEPSSSPSDEPSVSAGPSPSREPTPERTVTPGPTSTPGPDVPPQDATVDDDGRPQQVFTVGSVRYTIESVAAGPTIPEIDQPQSPFGGDWLAIVLAADNWGVGDAIVDMTQFTATVAPSGETRRLDSYSQVVAQRLGFAVVAGAADQFAIAPGATVRIGLLYLTDADATNFVLNAGTTTVDLTAAFNSSVPMNQLGELPAAPELLEATVTNVIDAVTIEVEIDGETVPVRYSGMIAPAVDSCVSGQATLANRDLVNGRTVWLERQNANVDGDGVWMRDVWVEGDSGSLELVSAVLAGAGDADADIQRPNSRYAAWVETAAYIAQLQSVGLWAPCEG